MLTSDIVNSPNGSNFNEGAYFPNRETINNFCLLLYLVYAKLQPEGAHRN